jgi:hypothetical protein
VSAWQVCRESNADPGLAPFSGQVVPDGPYVWVFGGHGVSQFSNATGTLTGPVIVALPVIGNLPQSPGALAATGQDLWVDSAGAVTEDSAVTGAVLRSISYGVRSPFGSIAAGAGRVWIASLEGGPGGAGALAELAAPSGRLLRTVAGSAVASPFALALASGQLWVIGDRNDLRPQLTELDAATGSLIRTISAPRYGFTEPFALAVSDGTVWVLNYDSATVVNATTGAVVRVERGTSDGLAMPRCIAAVGNQIWITNAGGQTSISEYDARTGELVATVSGPA